MKSFPELEKERLEWSLATFPKATAIGSLRKCESELKEIEENIQLGMKDPIEYADAIMCLFDSAARHGISFTDIQKAYHYKIELNKSREWADNGDGSYSHVKNIAVDNSCAQEFK